MNKKRKAQTPEGNVELNSSKAKKVLRNKAQVTEDSEQKASVLIVQTDKYLSKVTAEEPNEECKENTKKKKLEMDLNTSKFLEDGTKASFQRKDKIFLPPSQGVKLVPVFKKPTKSLAERRDRNSEEATTVRTIKGQHIDRSIPGMTEGNIQNTVASSERPCLSHRLEIEDPEDKVILCEEPNGKLNVQMQDLDGIKSLDNDEPKVGLPDSAEGNQGLETESNLQTTICEKKIPENTNSFLMCTSDNASRDDPEKKQLPLKLFTCPVVNENSVMLAEEQVTGCNKRSQSEEEYLSTVEMDTEQNKTIHIILGADAIKEMNQNESRADVGSVECMPIGSQRQSHYVGTSSVAREESLDIQETDLVIPYKNENSEEQNNISNSTESFQHGVSKRSSSADENKIFSNTENVEHGDPKHSDICNNSENFGHGDTKYNSTADENNIFNNTENVEHGDPKHSSTAGESDICNNSENFGHGDTKHSSTADKNNIFNNTENVEHGDPKNSDICNNSEKFGHGDTKHSSTADENDIFNKTENFENGDSKHIFTGCENVIVQHTVETNMKSAVQSSNRITEQNSLCRGKTDVGKPHTVEPQDVSGKYLSTIQSEYKSPGKETEFSEQNCKQIVETRNLLFPDPVGGIQSESNRNVMQEVAFTENKGAIKETEMQAEPVKNAIDTLDPNFPTLLTEHEENSEKLPSSVKQLEVNICDLTPGLAAKSEKSTAQQTLDNSPETKTIESVPFVMTVSFKEGIVKCEENQKKLESSLSSTGILPVPTMISDPTGEGKTDLGACPTSPSKTASNPSVLCLPGTMAQISASSTDTLALDLELLPESELQTVFNKYNLGFSPHEDNPHGYLKDESNQYDSGEQSRTKTPYPITDTVQSNSERDGVNSDLAKQEDATDVVCGLIKELSNLNRTIMSMHRDLDSFKRLKLRRNRQPGKLLSHSMNNITNVQCMGRKKREL